MKFQVPTGPLPILPPYFVWNDPATPDWEEIDLGDLIDRTQDDFTEIDLVDLV